MVDFQMVGISPHVDGTVNFLKLQENGHFQVSTCDTIHSERYFLMKIWNFLFHWKILCSYAWRETFNSFNFLNICKVTKVANPWYTFKLFCKGWQIFEEEVHFNTKFKKSHQNFTSWKSSNFCMEKQHLMGRVNFLALLMEHLCVQRDALDVMNTFKIILCKFSLILLDVSIYLCRMQWEESINLIWCFAFAIKQAICPVIAAASCQLIVI